MRPSRTETATRRPLYALLALFAVVLAAGFLGSGDGQEAGPETPAWSEVVARSEPLRRDVQAYEVEYRVENFGPAGSVTDTETRWVQLPFESRVEVVSGHGPTLAASSNFTQIASFGVLQSTGLEEMDPGILTVGPAPAPGEVRVSQLGDLVEAGLAEFRDLGARIVERECELWRVGAPVDVGGGGVPNESNHAELCIDEAGLVLYEAWTVEGTLLRRRTATRVTEGIDDDTLFTVTGQPTPVRSGGGGLVAVTVTSRAPGVTSWELAAAPRGFALEGRYAYAPPFTDNGSGTRPASILDVYVADGELVVVENGKGPAPTRPTTAIDVWVPSIGAGVLTLGYWEHEVRFEVGDGRFVSLRSTLARDRLLAIADELQAHDGDGAEVTRLDGAEPTVSIPLVMDITRCSNTSGELVCTHEHADRDRPPGEAGTHDHDGLGTHGHS